MPESLQETADLPGAKKFAGCFLSDTRQRNSLPGARPGDTRQRKASGKSTFAGSRALGKFQPSAKISLCRVPATRQNMAAGKGGRLDGGQRPSAFAGCHAVRHPAKNFFNFFLNFFAGCPMTWHPAKASLLGPAFLVTGLCRVPGDDGTRQRIFLIFFKFLCRVPGVAPDKLFCFFTPFFCGDLLR